MLINDFELVVLDELSLGLDFVGWMLIRDIVVELKCCGVIILFSLYILLDVEHICDWVVIFVGGKLVKFVVVDEFVYNNVRAIEVILE